MMRFVDQMLSYCSSVRLDSLDWAPLQAACHWRTDSNSMPTGDLESLPMRQFDCDVGVLS